MLDMPSARMSPDGQLAATYGLVNGSQRFNFSFQFLPWFEGSFRYSRIPHIRGVSALYDRSFGLKIRLVREDENWPDISMGIRDLLGTGAYGGEYFTASKRFGDFDVTAGLGWGRLAGVDTFPNPFGLIFPSFNKRQRFTGQGGTVEFGQFFHGPSMGLFGGVVWNTPIENLDLIAEYSSDKYLEEQLGGAFKVRMPVNVGLSYRLYDIATVSAGWFYGTTYGLTVSLHADPTVPTTPQRLGPEIPEPAIRSPKQQEEALNVLLAPRNHAVSAVMSKWVNLPSSDSNPAILAVTSALMSVGTGVRDVELSGRALIIDAQDDGSTHAQCDRYAAIAQASGLGNAVQTVAVSDLSSPSGSVVVCSPRHAADNAEPAVFADSAEPSDTPAAISPADISHKIIEDVSAQSIKTEALSIEADTVWLYFSNWRYQSESEAVGRIARVLMRDAPPNIEIFHIIATRHGLALRDFRMTRSALERVAIAYGTPLEVGNAVSFNAAPLSNPVLDRASADAFPQLHWSLGPGIQESFFDPSRPVQLEVLAALDVTLDLLPGLSIVGRGEANIFNTYSFGAPSDSQLPHVRSDTQEYFRHGLNGIAELDVNYRARIAPDIYVAVKGGYLESQFAGAGVQALWRPDDSRFSFGVDAYQVWQRDFNRLLGVQDYHVLTAHASVYYESPWYGLTFALHAGRYLAGDYGATFEVSRRFSTGIQIGAFATLTNVPFSKFGEGSFDKGIVVHIPLEWALPFYTQSSYDLTLRSLQRDGGARLVGDDSLFEETRPTSYGEVLGHIDEVTDP